MKESEESPFCARGFWRRFSESFKGTMEGLPNKKGRVSKGDWTRGIEEIIHSMYKGKYVCLGQRRFGKKNQENKYEFLNIDFYVFDNDDDFEIESLSRNIGLVAIEHENEPERIGYNLSKLLNVKARLKVFIGYCMNRQEISDTIKDISKNIKGIDRKDLFSDEELLVILGLDGMDIDVSQFQLFAFNLEKREELSLS